MWDDDLVELCSQCLAAAVAPDAEDGDLELSAGALAYDLADVHRANAVTLLDAAYRRAVADVDSSDVDATGFRVALDRLAGFRNAVLAGLVALPHAA
jgi:hypothetical protein